MFEEQPRKVHFYCDQKGATFGLKETPFANTVCRMNSTVPESHITTDASKVTCKICQKDHRFKVAERAQAGPPEVTQPAAKDTAPRFRYRRSWLGKLILQVCEDVCTNTDDPYDVYPRYATRWRDAKLSDLVEGVV